MFSLNLSVVEFTLTPPLPTGRQALPSRERELRECPRLPAGREPHMAQGRQTALLSETKR